jgi:predicted HTH domain antitoxin
MSKFVCSIVSNSDTDRPREISSIKCGLHVCGPADLLQVVSQLNAGDLAQETAKLLALELFREDKISMGRAAQLCRILIEAFMEFAANHDVPLHYGIAELEEDRRTLAKLRP